MQLKGFTYQGHKICSRCIMDDTVPGIFFDQNGVCSLCAIHDLLEQKYPINTETRSILDKLILQIKSDGKRKKYDCIVGVSGGRDSTYTLFNAVKLGLRPLAVHFDNGWNSQIAVNNIKKATEKLNVDLHTVVADWEEFKDLQRSFLLASVPDAEVPTDWVIFSVLFQAAAEFGVKYIIHGHSFRTEGTAPLSWTYMDGRYVNDIHKKFGTKEIKSFPCMTMSKYIFYSLVLRIKQIRLLYYLPYNENEVLKTLKAELDWTDYGDKHHESKYTAFFQSYILTRKFNIDKRKLHYSAKIRTDQISRNDALAIMKTDPFVGGDDLLNYCLKKLGFSTDEFERIMNAPVQSFRDYHTYYPIIQFFQKPITFANKIGIVPDTVFNKYYNLENID